MTRPFQPPPPSAPPPRETVGSGPVEGFLRRALDDPETGWSLGSFGALAAIRRDAGEAAAPLAEGRLGFATERGALALALPPRLRPVAYETAFATGWSHAVALCLPEEACVMARRATLTELGPDAGAAREEDRGAILFDLGLSLRAVDACIRTSDAALVARLRGCGGRVPLAPGDWLAAASPHRVFLTRMGRIEVFTPWQAGPGGPHTRIVPEILRAGRTHAATAPIPLGLVPCGALHPPHPARDATGRAIPFDRARHAAFQALLDTWGVPELVAAKRAVEAGGMPPPGPTPRSRYLRAALRAAEVQALYLRGDAPGAPSLRPHG